MPGQQHSKILCDGNVLGNILAKYEVLYINAHTLHPPTGILKALKLQC